MAAEEGRVRFLQACGPWRLPMLQFYTQNIEAAPDRLSGFKENMRLEGIRGQGRHWRGGNRGWTWSKSITCTCEILQQCSKHKVPSHPLDTHTQSHRIWKDTTANRVRTGKLSRVARTMPATACLLYPIRLVNLKGLTMANGGKDIEQLPFFCTVNKNVSENSLSLWDPVLLLGMSVYKE